jgi:gamma-glutamyltranspeptidase/glutathione hydrolase
VRPLLIALLVVAGAAGAASARRGAVAAEHRFAAEAGAAILREGGSAADAAVAAAAAVCVVHAASCGIGGGGFALVHEAGGADHALDYREVAPAVATPDRYLEGGKPDPSRTRTGGLAVAVPSEVAGWTALHERFGRLPLARVLASAIRLARDGFRLADSPHLRQEIPRDLALLRADPVLRRIFLDADGNPPGPDARIVQPELARTLERVGTRGWQAILAQAPAIARTVRERGGVLTEDDLRAYRPVWRDPLVGTFRGRRVVTFPPPGSGGIVLEVLGLLANDELPGPSPRVLHLLAGAMAQGFADRARWYGDTTVPVRTLLDDARLRRLRARIPDDRVGEPAAGLVVDAGTTNVSVVDADGDAVAMTTTINTAFGAGIVVPETGMLLNDEMDDFATPGQANAYGLTGGAANAITPGHRPQSSMSPTIVLKDGRPELVVGASGGPTIITGVVQTVLGVVAFGRDLRSAVDAPRIHDQATPPRLAVEPGIAADTRTALAKVGHQLVDVPALAAVSAAGLDEGRTPIAAGDRRKDGGEAVVSR